MGHGKADEIADFKNDFLKIRSIFNNFTYNGNSVQSTSQFQPNSNQFRSINNQHVSQVKSFVAELVYHLYSWPTYCIMYIHHHTFHIKRPIYRLGESWHVRAEDTVKT